MSIHVINAIDEEDVAHAFLTADLDWIYVLGFATNTEKRLAYFENLSMTSNSITDYPDLAENLRKLAAAIDAAKAVQS
ncbi:hypothetical protein [Roseobacter sp.]|uniref:hypothetical protein n=1 Tax=Roseobacter sp. TaxID=1907202 RepID=UPI002965D5CF|nr:hypothetical protein [Roseobacter sp.]MDW3181744.1 hypothetical protein [Roseobacter sp.]